MRFSAISRERCDTSRTAPPITADFTPELVRNSSTGGLAAYGLDVIMHHKFW